MRSSRRPTSGIVATAAFLLGTLMTALCLQSVLGDATVAGTLFSRRIWEAIAAQLGATRGELTSGEFPVGFPGVWLGVVAFAGTVLLIGSSSALIRSRLAFKSIVTDWATRGWLWWLLPGAWELLRVAAVLSGSGALLRFFLGSLPLWLAIFAAGWLTSLFCVAFLPESGERKAEGGTQRSDEIPHPSPLIPHPSFLSRPRRGLNVVLALCAVYVAVFVWMNWQMYFALNIPHGDSAMYEEHLWNTWHGKGFRSYLDDGRLFLGEHIQVVHLLLLPLHMLWPSQLLLELCESLALAAGAVPVYWMARRHTGSARCGVLLAAAFLLYVPLHYLDIAIDGKTFRPTSFGVPALLFALDQLERRRFRTMALFLLLTLSAKEDYAVMVACIGIWLASSRRESTEESPNRRWWGVGLAVFGAAYLLFVVKFAIPYFRGGDVHYARYFGELGNSPGDIVRTAFSQPGVVLAKLFSVRSALYALYLLAPIGFLPLRSPGRLAVGLPWFAMLCLLELTSVPAQQGQQMLVPWHHFHAPLVPILFWAAVGGLGARWRFRQASRERQRPEEGGPEIGGQRSEDFPRPSSAAVFAVASALCTSLLLSFHPLSVGFWDPGAQSYWKKRYLVDERARQFATAFELVPQDARVFSTDFVHTRFTHHTRSYDYSAYKRKSDEELVHPVPGETYYIVIDTRSRYSTITKPSDVPEYRNHPDRWELLRHDAEDYFIVLRRRPGT